MKSHSESLTSKFRKFTIIPLVLFGILTLIVSSSQIYISTRNETKIGLHNLTYAMDSICEMSGKGDYSIKNNLLYKGDEPFDSTNKIVDNIKKDSGVEASIFWGGERVSTTIRDINEKRVTGTYATDIVQKVVLKQGDAYFSDNVLINHVSYFGQYIPLRNSDGKVVGMLFAGKSRADVMGSIFHSIAIITILLIFMLCIASYIALSFSGHIVAAIKQIKKALGSITQGDTNITLDKKILERKDEIGDLALFTTQLQKNVIELINRDALTGLYNRRCATLALSRSFKEFQIEKGVFFTTAIGDIDDFKEINDTYGHNVGDEVLKELANIFMQNCFCENFVSRWGGEEFLFIFSGKKVDVLKQLHHILEEIHELRCIAMDGRIVSLTMTFGVCEYEIDDTIESVLKKADDNLYLGKKNGKDQIR